MNSPILLLLTSVSFATLALGARAEPAAPPLAPPGPPPQVDTRTAVRLPTPVVLQQLEAMRGFLASTQEIVGAVASDDFRKVEAAAKVMGHSPEREKKVRTLMAGAPTFADQAIGFFKSADAIGEAARRKDSKAVLRNLEATMGICTGCHAAFRFEPIVAKK